MSVIKIQGKIEKEQGIYYEVNPDTKPLGEGGMGKVFAGVCVNEKTGSRRDVAIKFLYDDLDEQTLRHARREASIQLHNDNLVEMFGFSETEEVNVLGETVKHYHIASELLDGITLADLLEGKIQDNNGNEIPMASEFYDEFQKKPATFALKIVRSVLSGLMALHDAGYIHRDIDPSNIMLTSDGRIKIIDFGIAKKLNDLATSDRAMTVSGVFIGKPEYAAPELVLGDILHQDLTTDIYAVGILLFQCATGHIPFQGPRHEVLKMQQNDELPLKKVKNKTLRDIIKKATEKKQAKRFQSAAEFIVAIEKGIIPETRINSTPIIIAVTVIGLVIGIVLGWLI